MNRLLLLFFFGVVTILPAQDSQSEGHRFVTIEEVVSGWQEHRQVWISGNLKVSASRISSLEQWLSENGPNWTVVLMEDARGQRYQDFQGMDAVEYALGEGLSNQTNFGEVKDSRTGESNGAVFVLFLKERKFSYFGSDVFDRRNLGEDKWIGRLDREAIRAMRSGGRIVDAVKNTVTLIEGQLTKAIEKEAESRRRQQIERQKQIEAAKLLPAKLSERIQALQSRATAMRSRLPDFRGELAYPPDTGWLAGAKAISLYVNSGEIEKAVSAAQSIFDEIDQYEQSLNLWQAAREQIDKLTEELKTVPENSGAPAVTGYISQAKASLKSTLRNHLYGDSIYTEQLAIAGRSIEAAKTEHAAYLAKVEAENQRVKVERIRNTGVGGGVGLFLLSWVTFLHRKRKKSKEKAEKMFIDWRKKLRGKFDLLFDLMDRTSVIKSGSERYTGETAGLLATTVRQVDELFIISAATDRVMETAADLIDPRNPWGKLVNSISKKRFLEGVAVMESKAIGFGKDEGLKKILKNGKRSLLGNEDDYEPFSMSFKQFVEVYNDRENTAIENLERLERCVGGLPLTLQEASADIEQLTHQISGLTGAAEEDGLFYMADFDSLLIESAKQNLGEASATGKTDPVKAMEESATVALRQIADATNLASVVESSRAIVFPVIHHSSDLLEKMGISTRWIDEAFSQHSEQVEDISQVAVDKSVAAEIEELSNELICTKGRVQSALDLAKQTQQNLPERIRSVEKKVHETRADLAGLLRLDADDILTEEGLNPTVNLAEISKARGRIGDSLNRGNIESAREDFQLIDNLFADACGFIQISIDVAGNGKEDREFLEIEWQKLCDDLPGAVRLMEEMTTRYLPGILQFKERFSGNVSGQKSLIHSADLAESHLTNAKEFLNQSREEFDSGKLIASGASLDRASDEVGFASHQIALIKDHYTELKNVEAENEKKLGDLQYLSRNLLSKIENPKTCPSTISDRQKVVENLAVVAAKVSASVNNPFENRNDLALVQQECNRLEDSIQSDWNWHRTAVNEAKKARSILDSVNGLLSVAKNDGIPDSRKLEAAANQYRKYEKTLLDWQVYLSSSHRDWKMAWNSVVEVESQLSKTSGVVEEEIQAANHAASQIRSAADAISELKSWRSGYRLQVDRDAGYSLFETATNALAEGDYRIAASNASAAANSAASALANARALEMRARAAEEAERRRRAAAASRRQRASIRSTSSMSSIRRGSSSSSRRSGSSRSGFSRSGW
ncbi:MAG: hypothetical protein P1V20_14265 [Verrucomicrobiales bacterium]|nr:hypothetical protein [Verrucomicrobiales bacterium]